MLPLREMAENFRLVSKSLKPKLGRRSYFTPEGRVALMFLKMYTGLSCPKLKEKLNENPKEVTLRRDRTLNSSKPNSSV